MSNKKLYSANRKIISNLLFYLILLGPYIAISADTWQAQISGIGNSLRSVFFLDEFNGWTVGSYGAIVHTTNGGENWNQQTSGSNKDFNCVYFIDTATGWISGSQGTILKTIDGGNSWSPQNSFTVYNLLSIHFATDSTGWVVGTNGTILKTTNGGTNWIPQNSPFSEVISDVDFVDALNGWAAAYESGATSSTILKTTDGGDLWEIVTVPMLIPWPVISIDFINRDIGWLVGYLEIIYKSTDGGNTWFEQTGVSSIPEVFYSVSFADENNGWAVGYGGVIAHTADGGNLWTAQASGTTNILWDVYFVNPTTGWVVGNNGLILKYTIPVFVEENELVSAPNKFILYNNYPNPFNPATLIKYSIPESGTVKLTVYNALGEAVKTLVNNYVEAGTYTINFNASDLSSGIYYYRLQTNTFIEAKKMLLLK